jgi:ribose transport system permease protein
MATATGNTSTVESDTLRRERIFGAIQRRGALAVLVAIVVVAGLTLDLFLSPRNIENVVLHASFIELPAFIVTLAGLLGIRGLALLLSGTVTIPIAGPPAFVWFGRGEIFGLDVPVVIMFVAFALGALVLNRTRYGEAIFAVGGNEEAARLAGVQVDRVKIIAYTTSGALAGLAGALVAAWISAGQPTVGQAWELYAIASVVLGGTLLTGGAGTMLGSLVGVLIFYTIQNVINQIGTLTSYTQQLVTGIFLIVVVAAQTYLTRKRTS